MKVLLILCWFVAYVALGSNIPFGSYPQAAMYGAVMGMILREILFFDPRKG